MAFQIYYHKVLFIQYIIFDYIFNKTLERIDLSSEEGQIRYISIFGKKKFNRLIRHYHIEKLVIQCDNGFILRKSLIYVLFQNLNERSKRLVAAFISLFLITKNISSLSKLFKLDMKTIRKGQEELIDGPILEKNRIRKKGGGRKTKEDEYKEFPTEIDQIIDDDLAGDPMSDRKWTKKTLRNIKGILKNKNIKSSINTIRKYLRKEKISLKANDKSISFKSHPDRNLQFEIIKEKKNDALENDVPLISIDTKKKEKIGNFKNHGRTYQRAAYNTLDHDFPNYATGKLIPFGIYDISQNHGSVYCGTSFETSEFAVDALVLWWKNYGINNYPNTKEILIICDGGGANGSRRRTWKYFLQIKFVDLFGISVSVCHFPPYTSKWNPIERRLFSFISINWAGEPLINYEKALELINSTKTDKGLQVKGHLLDKEYTKGQKITEEQMDSLNLVRDQNFPQWNYSILPRKIETKN